MNKQDQAKELADIILDKLTEMSDKFVRKHKVEPHILSALQIASINFLGSVIMANTRMIPDKSQQLDYVELVKTDTNIMLEQAKVMIKSVDLH